MIIERMEDSGIIGAPTYSTSCALWAFVLGLLTGIFGTTAGLIIYGLARDQEQQSFGWFVLIGSMIPLIGMIMFFVAVMGGCVEGLNKVLMR